MSGPSFYITGKPNHLYSNIGSAKIYTALDFKSFCVDKQTVAVIIPRWDSVMGKTVLQACAWVFTNRTFS